MSPIAEAWAAAIIALAVGTMAVAQPCEPRWISEGGVLGVDGAINASVIWDPDGDGPATARLVVAGEFTAAGSVMAGNIAARDLQTGEWFSIGEGLEIDGPIHAMAVLPGGDLVIGGDFGIAGGTPVSSVARWNGTAWTPLGAGADDAVRALAVLPGGVLVAAGDFRLAGDIEARGIARWDGIAWSTLGGGLDDPLIVKVNAMAVLPGGDLVAGGAFQFAGGVEARGIARWNGSSWTPLGPGMNGVVNALVATPDGDLLAGGAFTVAGGIDASRVARWNGLAWAPVGGGVNGEVHALEVLDGGDVIATGWFVTASGVTVNRVARWNGSAWSALGGGMNGAVNGARSLPDGGLLAFGHFGTADVVAANSVARWDGTRWNPLGVGMPRHGSSMVQALLAMPQGHVLVAGGFTTATGAASNYVAMWNGATWSAAGSGLNGVVRALARRSTGEVIAAGAFTTAGNQPAAGVAMWNGESWSPMGGGPGGTVHALAVLLDDSVVAAGSTGAVVRWNGASWAPLGSAFNGAVFALASLPDGSVAAGGAFTLQGTTVTNRVARWNGAAWTSMGGGVGGGLSDRVLAMATLPDGDLVVGGEFAFAGTRSTNAIARWNGSDWFGLAGGMSGGCSYVSTIVALPAGGLIAGGRFTSAGGIATSNVASWNGVSWSGLGMHGPADASFLNAMTMLPGGDLVLGGWVHPGGIVARRFAGGPPAVAWSPLSGTAFAGETLTMTAAPINGMADVSFRWRRNGVDMADGPGGATPGGGVVMGASGSWSSPTSADVATLTIEGITPADAGRYEVVFSNACGSRTSSEAIVDVVLGCAADFNLDGGVDGMDVFEFFAAWQQGEMLADVNYDGGVDGSDAEVFFFQWESGGC